MDHDHPVRPDDQLYGVSDMVSAHLTKTDEDSAEGLSDRLEKVAPITFADNSDRSSLFTTLSNSFRYFSIRHDLNMRPWEWTADSDNDQYFEFPPAFGPVGSKVLPFTAADPFRPQTRRLLFAEAIEGRGVQGQLPLSVNHILDVNRTDANATRRHSGICELHEADRAAFSPAHRTSTGLGAGRWWTGYGKCSRRFRLSSSGHRYPSFHHGPRLIGNSGRVVIGKLLARDIYVLLYTIGGAQWDGTSAIIDYTS